MHCFQFLEIRRTPMLSGSKKQSDEERGGSLFDVCWSYLLADLSTNRP
jgi:hypothetical protein